MAELSLVQGFTTTPVKTTPPQAAVTTPPNGIVVPFTPPSSSGSLVTPSKTQPYAILILPGTPAMPQSCPPKPKLSKEERDKQRLERERLRAEKKQQRDQEKIKKEQEKMKKEQEKRERQLQREQEARERQERRALEEQSKREKREKKEAEKRQKEEERLKAEQEMLRQKQKNKERFLSFFGKTTKEESIKPTKQEYSFITPFSVKSCMTLASRPRQPLEDTSEFDRFLEAQDTSVSVPDCVVELRKWAPSVAKTQPIEEIKPVEIIELKVKRHFKLLQFRENHRPAYYGTWSKTSSQIKPRNPFKKDQGLLDYSVDSDEEWEEEDPGESISNSEGEDSCGDEGGSDEEDDGFFVPHGYLSDGEGEEEMAPGFDPGADNIDDETKRKKVAAKAKAWEVEFARKCHPLKPVKIGCVWSRLTGDQDLSKDESFLQQFAAVALVDLPITAETVKRDKEQAIVNEGGSTESARQPVPEEAMPDLIRLVHGNSIGISRIAKTFQLHWGAKKLQGNSPTHSPPDPARCVAAARIAKSQLEKKVKEIAVKEIRPPNYKPHWYIHDSILAQYNIDAGNLTPLIPLYTSPKTKSSAPVSSTNLVSSCEKKKPEVIKTMFETLRKTPSPPKPKRIKLQLHVDKQPQTPSGRDQQEKTKGSLIKEMLSVSEKPPVPLVALQNEARSEKRELESPVLHSAAKRLCLGDSTNINM